MRLVKIGLASLDTTVGAVRANAEKVVASAHQAAAQQVTVLAFPEQSLGGYSPEDLVQWRRFVEAQYEALENIAARTAELDVVLAIGLAVGLGSDVYNAAACVHRGRILGIVPKEKLPGYNVFYEARTLTAGRPGLYAELPSGVPFGDLLFQFDFGVLALEICEDIWTPDGPLRRRAYAGAELALNLSASPYRVGMVETRREMIATRAADTQITLGYVNLVGGNDGLVFDGGAIVAQNGRRMLEGPRFCETLATQVVDLDRTQRLRTENTTFRHDRESYLSQCPRDQQPRLLRAHAATSDRSALRYPVPEHGSFFLPSAHTEPSARERFAEDLLSVLALGVGSYFRKTGAFQRIGVALSGGRDSVLCLLIAARWLESTLHGLSEAEKSARRADVLHAFYLPSRYSSKETEAAARQAALDVGASFVISPIDDAFQSELVAARGMLGGAEPTGTAPQNIQARLRAERMWTWANSTGALFLQTSNMSEKAVGYTTIGGDMEGALSVIANLPKTVVNFLLDYLLEKTGAEGIRLTLLKPASAELAPDQEDEKDLMPFPVLDACFALYAGEKLHEAELNVVLGTMFPDFDAATLHAWISRFLRLFAASIYKWVQTPLALHVGNLDLDRERALQLPVVQSAEWQR